MFPARLLETRPVDGDRIAPVWLGADDDAWLGELAEEARACDGRRVDDADERIRERVMPHARRQGMPPRVVEAVWALERKAWKTRIGSAVPPVELRRLVFELGAERDREEALATIAAQLGLEVAQIERTLFADRPRARLLVAPALARSAMELRDAYNLAVVQTLLSRSVEIVATVRSDLDAVVSHAKRVGLLATYAGADDGATHIAISGPLAVFHHTLKYSRAIATWFPSLVATKEWSLEATVVLAGETKRLSLDESAPIPRATAHEEQVLRCEEPWGRAAEAEQECSPTSTSDSSCPEPATRSSTASSST